jgi:hypothetical protein
MTMRNPVLAIAITFMLAASCTVALAQSFEAYQSFKGTKQSKYKGGDSPPPPPPPKTGTVKPVSPTINPALQGNVLQKGTVSGSTGSKTHIEAITVKQK